MHICQEHLTVVEDKEEQAGFIRKKKKTVLGCLKFISELLKSKVFKKNVFRTCVDTLITSFLRDYSLYETKKDLKYSTYDLYFEGLLEFIGNLGDTVEDKKDKNKEEEPTEK